MSKLPKSSLFGKQQSLHNHHHSLKPPHPSNSTLSNGPQWIIRSTAKTLAKRTTERSTVTNKRSNRIPCHWPNNFVPSSNEKGHRILHWEVCHQTIRGIQAPIFEIHIRQILRLISIIVFWSRDQAKICVNLNKIPTLLIQIDFSLNNGHNPKELQFLFAI